MANTVGFNHCVTNLTTNFSLSAWLFKAKVVPNDNILLPFRQRLPFLCHPPQGVAKVAAPSSLSNVLEVKLVFSELRFSPENAVVSAVPE